MVMKVKIKTMGKFLRFVLRDKIAGITLAPFGIYVMERYLKYQRLINHESIHWKQQVEMLFLFFYLWYFIEWLIKGVSGIFLRGGESAYRRLSFEREARDHHYDDEYLKTRKPYSWVKYIFKRI
jgi:hypothetical protein